MKHMLSICPVSLLEESTMELRPSSRNCVWWSILEEIYSIRRKQQRFENQEIGRSSSQPVLTLLHAHKRRLDGGTTIHVEVPPLVLTSLSRGSIVGPDLKIKDSQPQIDSGAGASSAVLKLAAPKVEDSFPSLKSETAEPAPALDDYPQRISFDGAHNEMGDPNGNDMNLPIPLLIQGQASDPRAAALESTTQASGFRMYQSSYSSTHDKMLNGTEMYGSLWADVGDLSLNLRHERPDRPFVHGLPSLHPSPGLESNCNYMFGSPMMSNQSEALLHQSSANPAGLDLQNTPRQVTAAYANDHAPARRPKVSNTTTPSIDPRNLSLLEQYPFDLR